jgi:hypothetical protein
MKRPLLYRAKSQANMGQRGRAAGKSNGNARTQRHRLTVFGGQRQGQKGVAVGFGRPQPVKADFSAARTSAGMSEREWKRRVRSIFTRIYS